MNIYSKITAIYPESKNEKLDILFGFVKNGIIAKVGLKKGDRHKEIVVSEKLAINIDYAVKRIGTEDVKVFQINVMCFARRLCNFQVTCESVGYNIESVEKIIKYAIDNNGDKLDFLLNNLDRVNEYCTELAIYSNNSDDKDYISFAEKKYKDLLDKKIILYYECFGDKYYRMNHDIYSFFENDINIIQYSYDNCKEILEQQSRIWSAKNNIHHLLEKLNRFN